MVTVCSVLSSHTLRLVIIIKSKSSWVINDQTNREEGGNWFWYSYYTLDLVRTKRSIRGENYIIDERLLCPWFKVVFRNHHDLCCWLHTMSSTLQAEVSPTPASHWKECTSQQSNKIKCHKTFLKQIWEGNVLSPFSLGFMCYSITCPEQGNPLMSHSEWILFRHHIFSASLICWYSWVHNACAESGVHSSLCTGQYDYSMDSSDLYSV